MLSERELPMQRVTRGAVPSRAFASALRAAPRGLSRALYRFCNSARCAARPDRAGVRAIPRFSVRLAPMGMRVLPRSGGAGVRAVFSCVEKIRFCRAACEQGEAFQDSAGTRSAQEQ